MDTICYQVNLQQGFGGGEVYTEFFAGALKRCGIDTVLFAHPEARYWTSRLPPNSRVEYIADNTTLVERMANTPPAWVVCHAPLTAKTTAALREQGHRLCCFAHMPWYQRSPALLAAYETIIPVSAYVLDSLLAARLNQAYREPLLGMANIPADADAGILYARSIYDWDRRKFRDRVLSWLEPCSQVFSSRRKFERLSGITLGIVSRLTPIKQFPLLFNILAPILAQRPHFRLEIFGSGGYASVRDLKRALRPIRERTRFWGFQSSPSACYQQIDYLLSGLPEKEALGLNIIEAQACGTPVLAVNAPPFVETIDDNVTGLLYPNPLKDGGAGFARLLDRLENAPFQIHAGAATPHLKKFSSDAFQARVDRLVVWCKTQGML